MSDSNYRIILADDDQDDCFLFNEALEEYSKTLELTIVNDGVELMQRLTNKSDNRSDVVFLDLNMPRKNGLECIIEIMRNKKLRDIPIIIYSTSFDNNIVNKLYDYGAQYYIKKPSDFSTLKKVVHQALTNLQETARSQPNRENFVLAM